METTLFTQSWSKKLQCRVDEDADYENTYWCNRDLIPIPPNRRKWTWQGYAGYWVIAGINTTVWTIGSSLLSLGLSVGQAMAMVICATIITALLAVIAGYMGSHLHLGFTVISRSSWGIRGAFWPVMNRVVIASIFMGIQMYWGGQAIRIILGSIIGPRFTNMENTLPASANITTLDLICFFIFIFVLVPALWVKPEKLQVPFRVAFAMITSVMLGMLIWALVTAKGAGSIISSSSTVRGSILSWNSLYGMQSFLGTNVGTVLGQSDWTRYAKTPNAAVFGQAITAPLTLCVTAICGILITSASSTFYRGQVLWNPFELLLYVQQSMTPAARAGTFFAGLGLLASQLALCIVLISLSASMDLTAICPKYINIRRGSYIVMVVGIAVCPWTYVNEASTFVTVISGWGVFFSPMVGILLADFYVLRRRELHIGDLYVGNSTSAYWFTAGFNWRTPVAWAMGVWPLLPGFVRRIRVISDYNAWDNLFVLEFFIGFSIAFIVHLMLHKLFPAPGRLGSSPFSIKEHGVLKTEDAV